MPLFDSDGAYVHDLFGLLLAWGITIRCARSYFHNFLFLRITKRHAKNVNMLSSHLTLKIIVTKH